MWTAVKIIGVIAATLLTLIFIFILIMVTRPAILAGVDGTYLANSLAGSSGEPACRKADDDRWDCYQLGSPLTHYRAEVDWMGCWKATRISRNYESGLNPKRLDGCIELGDIITFD